MSANSGIYIIRNIQNGNLYVGSAINFSNRWYEHKKRLKKDVHHSVHLQRAWNKYGGENFVFDVIETLEDTKQLIIREQYYIDYYLSKLGRDNLYNICLVAYSSLGVKHSAETRLKISLSKKGRSPSVETRLKHSIRMMGKQLALGYRHTTEARLKISQSNLGRQSFLNGKHTDEAKLKISQSLIGNNRCLGFKHSEQAKLKMSTSKIGCTVDVHTRNKISQTLTGRKHDEERVSKSRQKLIETTSKPEYRLRMSLIKKGLIPIGIKNIPDEYLHLLTNINKN